MLKNKMLRDIRLNISQFLSIFLMVIIGVMVYTGIEGYMLGMEESASEYYNKNNLQDLDAYGKLTSKELQQIKELEHVLKASGKLTFLGNNETFKGHTLELNFIEDNEISKFYVVDGESFQKDINGIYLDAYYALNNNIKVGDKLKITYNDLELDEEVKALIMVPDHVYDVKDETEVFPSHLDYGYAYLSLNEITEKFIKAEIMKEYNIKTTEHFNYLFPNFNYKDYLSFSSILIDVDSKKYKQDVKTEVSKIEGVAAVFDIENEESFYQYKREQEEGESYIGIFSGLFIFIALLSVITTMTRMIRKERIQIGTLKALGFSNMRITMHYLSYGFFVSFLGAVIGLIIGYFGIGNLFMWMEMTRFEVPVYHTGINISVYLVAIITVLLISIATYLSTRKILKEKPSDALRPERPKVSKHNFQLKHGSFSTRWNLRDIIRNKTRTIMGLVGIVGCMILLVVALGMLDTMNNYMHIELDVINNYKYRLNFDEAISKTDYDQIIDNYGDNTSKTLGIEIECNDSIITTNLFVHDASDRFQIIDDLDNPFILKDGVYLTRKFAEVNNIKIGDRITWSIYGDTIKHESVIVGFNKDPQNQNMTMNKKTYEDLGYTYKPDSLYTNVDLNINDKISGITTIQDIETVKEGVMDMLELMMIMIYIMVFFAAVLGIIIIYNMGILSFSEKDYQFATLKVLGFSNKKISYIFIKQNIWIAVLAIIISIPLGYSITDYVFKGSLGDSYDISVNIKTISYLISALSTLLVTILVSIFLCRKIREVDMVKSLKGSE